jgi:hypothetical protein
MGRRPVQGLGYPVHRTPPQGKTSSSSKDLAKQPLNEPTWAPFTSLPDRANGMKRGSLEDSRTGPNNVEASN